MATELEKIAASVVIILACLAAAVGGAWWIFGHDSIRYSVGVVALLAYGLAMLGVGGVGTYLTMSHGGQLVASATEIQAKGHLADAQLVKAIVEAQLKVVNLQQKGQLSLENSPSMEVFQPNHFFVSSDSNLN